MSFMLLDKVYVLYECVAIKHVPIEATPITSNELNRAAIVKTKNRSLAYNIKNKLMVTKAGTYCSTNAYTNKKETHELAA